MSKEIVIVLDFGGQYNQLIARRVRECNVYCEVLPYSTDLDTIREMSPKGIIFTGGPSSVYGDTAPKCSKEIFDMGIPILGICYGAQLMSYLLGGTVSEAPVREYGRTELTVDRSSLLFANVEETSVCWMSHTDYVKTPPEGFSIIAETDKCPCAAMCDETRKLYGVQFHPEVSHTVYGK